VGIVVLAIPSRRRCSIGAFEDLNLTGRAVYSNDVTCTEILGTVPGVDHAGNTQLAGDYTCR
jgi:hypothetical protein